jgi:hypothetical protein
MTIPQPPDRFIEICGEGVAIEHVTRYRYRKNAKMPTQHKLILWYSDGREPLELIGIAAYQLYLALHANSFDIGNLDLDKLEALAYPNRKE